MDVAVDLRKNSVTFGKYFSVIMSEKSNFSFYIPEGFAHGFLCLSKNCTVLLEMPKSIEACPLKLAPTSSTTVSLVLGDALAIALLEKNKFTRKKFSELHPGGKLGRMLLKVKDIMKTQKKMILI